ncbi:MAG: hypothetical protein AAGF23_10960 [Acidobacteriota bacterium]
MRSLAPYRAAFTPFLATALTAVMLLASVVPALHDHHHGGHPHGEELGEGHGHCEANHGHGHGEGHGHSEPRSHDGGSHVVAHYEPVELDQHHGPCVVCAKSFSTARLAQPLTMLVDEIVSEHRSEGSDYLPPSSRGRYGAPRAPPHA